MYKFKKQMENLIGIVTSMGVLTGREAIYLHDLLFLEETDVLIKGEISSVDDNSFTLKFNNVVYFSAIELDFDERTQMESFAVVENSEKLARYRELDHSRKLSENHKHYYVRTYDTVIEVISDNFYLSIAN